MEPKTDSPKWDPWDGTSKVEPLKHNEMSGEPWIGSQPPGEDLRYGTLEIRHQKGTS